MLRELPRRRRDSFSTLFPLGSLQTKPLRPPDTRPDVDCVRRVGFVCKLPSAISRWLDSADRHAQMWEDSSMKITRRRILARALVAGGAILATSCLAPCRRGLSGTPRDDHQSICSGQHLGRRGASDCAIPAGSIPAALHRREPGRRRGLVAVAVARAAPDGYTLLAMASSLHSGAALYKELPIIR